MDPARRWLLDADQPGQDPQSRKPRVWWSPGLRGGVCSLRALAPEASAPGPASAGFSLLITGIRRSRLECAILPVCGEFGRVWADGGLRLPNAELLAGPAANGSETRAGGPLADGSTERARSAGEGRAALNRGDALWASTHIAGHTASALGSRPAITLTPGEQPRRAPDGVRRRKPVAGPQPSVEHLGGADGGCPDRTSTPLGDGSLRDEARSAALM